MKQTNTVKKPISRRHLLPLLLGTLVIPCLGLGKMPKEPRADHLEEGDTEYETFLKADGSVVRVKKKSLKNARVVKKNVSNQTLLRWLKKL